MKQKGNKLWYIALGILFSAASCKSQELSGWQTQPVSLQTRWAKDVHPDKPLNVYPRPQLERKEWENLNGLWEYAITEKDSSMPAVFEGKILVPYPLESALSGVAKPLKPDQSLWYKRTIAVKNKTAAARTILHFGAVDFEATVYLNGEEVGKHRGGYQHFDIDITDALKQSNNEIVVKVNDPTDQGINPHGKQTLYPANIFYTSTSGIWQTVWLETVSKDYIKGLKITPNIDQSSVQVTVKSDANEPVEITTAGRTVKGNANDEITVPVPNPKLWSPENPYLYDLKVKMGNDEVKSYFGMRKVSIQKDDKGFDRIFLNNKPYYNLGVLDQGFWPDGLYTAPTDEALAFDIKAIKDMGFNTIRKHIKIEPDRWYYYADKIGMLVWQDMVQPGNTTPEGKAEFEREMKENIAQLYNHPSITTWVLFNEKWGQYDQKRLTDELRQIDPTRIVNGHSGEYLYVNGQLRSPSPDAYVDADLTDVHSYPFPMLPVQQPGKAMVCGEFGGIGVSVPYHEWNDLKGWGYVEVLPGELITKYDSMMHMLKQLQTQGLSGSIYTQPFDVEGEENGLMTYDRDIIKIPLKKIREINSLLNPDAENYHPGGKFSIGKDIDPNDNDNRYPELLKEFGNGKKDSAFLRRLTLMAIRKKDQNNATKVGAAYIHSLKNVFSKNNLNFIKAITRSSKDTGFQLMLKDSSKVNQVLGDYNAQNFVMDMLDKEDIAPYIKDTSKIPDWSGIEKTVSQYGALGTERVYMNQLLYYWIKKPNADSLSKYYVKYFTIALPHSRIHINNCSWAVFEKVNDPSVLNFAVKVMKYDIEHFDMNNPQSWDTYANLLYKTGNKSEALKWEEKAAKAMPNDKSIQETYTKMKRQGSLLQ